MLTVNGNMLMYWESREGLAKLNMSLLLKIHLMGSRVDNLEKSLIVEDLMACRGKGEVIMNPVIRSTQVKFTKPHL